MSNFNNYFAKAKYFYTDHKDLLNKIAMPVIVVMAILFFWVYGSGGNEVEISEGLSAEEPVQNVIVDESGENILTETGTCFVDIGGAVKYPGVYEVESGSRIFQIIEAAGGLRQDAVTTNLNMAESVYDGQKIIVPSENDASVNNDSGYAQNQNVNNEYNSNGIDAEGRVNLNYADSVGLQTLPGIGPSKAAKIIEYRDANGQFSSIEEIKKISGIGDKTFESIKEYLVV